LRGQDFPKQGGIGEVAGQSQPEAGESGQTKPSPKKLEIK